MPRCLDSEVIPEKPISMTTTLALFGNKVLRSAIQRNLVSIPAQFPLFAKQDAGELHARISQLYFVRGWSVKEIGKRYGMSGEQVRKSLSEWRVRAISSGYIQEIGPEILPALEMTCEAPSPAEIEDEDTVRKPLQMISAPPLVRTESEGDKSSVMHLVLEQIETEIAQDSRWPAFCVRLLEILKQECMKAGFHLSTAQIERIEEVREVSDHRASDLLRDLRNRIADEERCTAILIPPRSNRVALFHVLIRELETTAQLEKNLWKTDSGSPRHCRHLVSTIKQGCLELGMDFSLVQAKRVENALSGDPEQLSDMLRDLRNRLEDEHELTELTRVPEHQPRQMAVGNKR
jgi:transposase-like protein